jgi:hypothetical protein
MVNGGVDRKHGSIIKKIIILYLTNCLHSDHPESIVVLKRRFA